LRFVILFLLVVSFLQAEYLRTIRIGTYPNENSAKEALSEIQEFAKNNPVISDLQQEWDFVFKERKSGKFYITLAEPFRDRKVLQQVLDNLRLAYPDIYVTRLKSYPPFKKTKHEIQEPTHSTSPKNEIKEVVTKKIEETKLQEKKQKFVASKELVQKQVVDKIEKDEGYSFYTFIAIVVFLLFLLVILFILLKKYKRDAEDILMQKMMLQEQLEQTNIKLKNKDKVFSHTSHELRNPMSAIIGLSHLLLEESMSQKQKEYVKKIEGSAKYLLEIINDILDISKMEAGALKIEQREFNLNHVIRHVINIVSVAARENGTRVELDIHKNVPPYIIGDSLRLTQVLINLLSNAVKFTKNGVVVLSIRKTSQHAEQLTLEFVVKDNGIGMTQNQLNSIFLSYAQASESTAREFGGTGLGLSIVKYLVDIMHGDIQVESKKQHGTTFVVHLQFDIRQANEKRFYRLPSREYLNKRVLIVEKTEGNVAKLKEAFSYFNYVVHTIPSFDDIVLDDNIKFDIVIINKDQVNKKLIDIIKRMKEENKTKFILFSNSVLELDKELLEELEIDEHLNRPFTQEDVLELLKKVCRTSDIKVQDKHRSLPKEKLKTLKPKKILIAEDNRLNHKVLGEILSDTPLELLFVENGEEALAIINSSVEKFDLIILDINMPKLNGYETAMEIRKLQKYHNTPILALTADVMQDAIDKTYEVGMQGHIAKPIIVNSFYEKLYKVLAEDETIYLSSQENNINGTVYKEFSPSKALVHLHGDEELYHTLLKDFKDLYSNSANELEELLREAKFEDARAKAVDIKDVAFNVGAYKLYEDAADMQYTFEKGSRGNYLEILGHYKDALYSLIKEIDRYLQHR